MRFAYWRCLAASLLVAAQAAVAAPTPPMGWNSYDAYGSTVSEAQVRANARWMSQHLARYGWRYVAIDAEWFVRNPTPSGGAAGALYVLDRYGRYVPAPNRFPSAANGAGFKPLAAYVHSLGLKFGIHILRGIPREAVAKNLPIAGSPYTAAQAADIRATCPWNPDNYGVDSRGPAGQAYYDSIARLYASWGVDLIKADCIASHPYAGEQIRMLSAAMRASGRDMALSLSPGPAPIDRIAALRRYSTMWRISNDVWDLWHSTVAYPQGVVDQFPRVARWAALAQPGHWPDADMLALGYLGPAPGWGKARASRLTHAEQRSYFTLWCIARSPLFMGGNLTRMDPWTASLLENSAVIAVDQRASDAHQALARDGFVIWLSRPDAGGGWYLAAFNTEPRGRTLRVNWPALALPRARYDLRDLWQHRDLGAATSLTIHLDAHGAALYRLSAR
ncbi:MAG TPA: glycoside hydrolase family 27 protein [Steroidobacteraceae bacterium]